MRRFTNYYLNGRMVDKKDIPKTAKKVRVEKSKHTYPGAEFLRLEKYYEL